MNNIYTSTTLPKTVSLQAYYTDVKELNDLMISLLGDVSNKTVLEPCMGKGAFIKPLIKTALHIDAIDIDTHHVNEVNAFNACNIKVQKGDFIDYFVSDDIFQNIKLANNYDALICNPPYGLKFSLDYRKKIKSKFPQIYARESYGLFMMFGISRLRQGGRFVFIVPDTFLISRNHKSLRNFLVHETNLSHIIQFNSSRFKTVNFGYSNMCILAGNRCIQGQINDLSWVDFRKKVSGIHIDLFNISNKLNANHLKRTVETGWVSLEERKTSFQCKTVTLGEIAECRTGIYTGNNIKFCGFDELKPHKRSNGHPINWDLVVNDRCLNLCEQKNGIINGRHYVPFIRGGYRLPFEPTSNAIDWSYSAVSFYKNDKKSRLQNSSFYFRRGIAIPMVTSGYLSASLFENCIFDQGVVGVFPFDENIIEFLLVFLNSDQASSLKKEINPTANNSANYIKRIQIPIPNDEQKKIAFEICKKWQMDRDLSKKICREMATEFINNCFPTI